MIFLGQRILIPLSDNSGLKQAERSETLAKFCAIWKKYVILADILRCSVRNLTKFLGLNFTPRMEIPVCEVTECSPLGLNVFPIFLNDTV